MATPKNFYVMQRGWMENAVFPAEPYTHREAFLWLIEHAAWDDAVHSVGRKRVPVKRGQLAVAVRFLAVKWSWKKDRVSRFLQRLKTETMIETLSDTEYTLITVCNYRRYQDISEDDAPPNETRDATRMRHERDNYNDNQINQNNNNNSGMAGGKGLPPLRPSPDDPLRAAKIELARWVDGFFQRPLVMAPAWEWLGKGASVDLVRQVLTEVTERRRQTEPDWIPRGLKYFADAVDRRLAKSSPDQSQAIEQQRSQWHVRVEGFRKSGFWLDNWGDPPDSQHCPAPASVLVEFGYRKGN